MREFPIKVGSMLFTIVEPHRGHEVEYNRWYERDHFYSGCLIGPGCLAGKRWVATRHEKTRRYPDANPITKSSAIGSYLATYWIQAGQETEWNRWALKQVHALHAENRMFAERDHVHTLMYVHAFDAVRDADGVNLALALDHPFTGLVVTAVDATAGRERLADWYREQLPSLLAGGPVQVVGAFTPLELQADAPGVQKAEADDDRLVLLWFVDGDLDAAWDATFADHGKVVADAGVGRLAWCGPFRATIHGTDTYTDQLW